MATSGVSGFSGHGGLKGLRSFGAPAVVLRDQRTLELQLFYPLPKTAGEQRSYTLDLYMYFPRGFRVTRESWSGKRFYRDTHVYLRLQAPALTLADLADLNHPGNPLALLRNRLPLSVGENSPSGKSFVILARMFGAELTDTVVNVGRRLKHQLAEASDPDGRSQFLQDVDAFCDDCVSALTSLQRVRAKAQAYQGVVHPALLSSLSFAEEYSIAVIEDVLVNLVHEVEISTDLCDGEGTAVRLRLIVARALEAMLRRRHDQGFALPKEHEAGYFLYRISLLKKELQRSLYLDTRKSRRDPFYTNSAAMVAAGLAATWATIAQVPLLVNRDWATREGMLLFGAAVGAYVLKDRIKDIVKNHLTRRWRNWDHDHVLASDLLAQVGLGAFNGRAREVMRFVDKSEVPDEIRALRRSRRTVFGASTSLERIAHYHKQLDFSSAGSSPLPDAYGVRELLRISLSDILRRLDDPRDDIAYYEPTTGRFMRTNMPRAYHLNLVVVARDEHAQKQHALRARVVVNQKQILHVEEMDLPEPPVPRAPK